MSISVIQLSPRGGLTLESPETVGIEPTTPELTALCYYQLSYISIYMVETESIEPIRVNDTGFTDQSVSLTDYASIKLNYWWRRRDLNSRSFTCKANALPSKLRPRMVGVERLELPTS